MTRHEQTLVLRTVAIILAILVLLLWFSRSVQADTGLLVDEWTEGGMRYCEYDVMGESYIITIEYADLCPLTVEV